MLDGGTLEETNGCLQLFLSPEAQEKPTARRVAQRWPLNRHPRRHVAEKTLRGMVALYVLLPSQVPATKRLCDARAVISYEVECKLVF